MKRLLKISTFRAIFLAAMSLIGSLKTTNAQTTITPGTPGNMIEAFNTIYGITVKKGDTVKVWWEYSADMAFSAPDTLPGRIFTKDSAKVRDTFTVSKNHLPPPKSITGYNMYIRPAMKIKGDTVVRYGYPIQMVTVYPKPLNVKIQNFKITPLSGGCIIEFFGHSGSNYEKVYPKYQFRYNHKNKTDIWRKPNPAIDSFIGMNYAYSRKLSGMFSNDTVDVWIKAPNSVSSWDTIVTFVTTPSSAKPVTVEASGKSGTTDSAFVKIEATSFGISSKFYCVNTLNGDTLTQTIASNKTEILTFRFGNLVDNTKYPFKSWGENTAGIGNNITVTITTQPKLTTPTFTALSPEILWDYSNLNYYMYPKIDWVTNSSSKIGRIDMRVYFSDSMYQTVPSIWKISDANASLNGPFTGPRIDIVDTGRYCYEFVIEAANKIYNSNLKCYTVNRNAVPKIIVPTLEITSVSIGSGSVTVNWKWTSDKDNLLTGVDAKVYKDASKTIQVYTKQILTGSSLAKTSGTGSFNITLDTGTFWVNLTGQSQLGSNPISTQSKFQIKFTAGIAELQKNVNNIPCPISDGNIQLGLQEESELTIFDESGKTVIKKHIEARNNNNVDLSTLKGGNYYLMLSDKKGIATRKIQIK